MIGLQAGRDALRPLGASLRLRAARPASSCPASSRGSCCDRRTTRAPRWATCRSARASRSRRCRWRPPTPPIANGGVMRRAVPDPGRREPGAPGASRAAPPSEVAKMLEGVLGRRAAPRRRRRLTATRWRARPARPRRPTRAATPRRSSWPRSSATRRRKRPAAAGGGDGRRAAGRHLRRHGGGAGLRAHHGVRAAVPEDPAALSGDGALSSRRRRQLARRWRHPVAQRARAASRACCGGRG